MAFAIFYDDSDAQAIAGALTRADLTNAERQQAQKFWNGGLKDWQTAPFGLSPCADASVAPANSSRRLVISAVGLTKQDFVNLLNTIGTRVGGTVGGYLTTLALDVAQCGQEPA